MLSTFPNPQFISPSISYTWKPCFQPVPPWQLALMIVINEYLKIDAMVSNLTFCLFPSLLDHPLCKHRKFFLQYFLIFVNIENMFTY